MSDFLVNIFGAAIGAGLINIFIQGYFQWKRSNIDYFKLQIKHLYGPLGLVCLEQRLNIKNSNSEAALGQQYKDINQIPNANYYAIRAEALNGDIYTIIQSEYHYLDVQDMEGVAEFIHNYQRLKFERDSQNTVSPEVLFSMDRAAISLALPSFYENFIKRFENKQKQILAGWWSSAD